MNRKRYIGDGVYADFDGYALVLTTENGIQVDNRIVVEGEVWTALVDYVKDLRAAEVKPQGERDGAHEG